MRRAYGMFLRLYPAEYRMAFGPEMMETLGQESARWRKRGALSLVYFCAREFMGVLKGLFREWVAKSAGGDAYSTTCSLPQETAEVSSNPMELQKRLTHLIRSMECAIAHHDFPKARFYSNEERITRALLDKFVSD